MKSLRRRYLIPYITSRIAKWAKAPYLYFLFMTVHKFSFAEIGILYLIPFIPIIILSIISGPLRSEDKIGRRFYFHICNIINIIGILLIIQGSRLLGYLGQIIVGIVKDNSIFEQWLNNEMIKEFGEFKKEVEQFKKRILTTSSIYDSIIGIITCIIVAFIFSYYGIKAPFYIYIFFAVISSIIIAFLWDENINNNKIDQSRLEVVLSALKELKKIDVLCIGLIQGIASAVFNIFLFMWTPILVESSSDKINIGFIFTIILFSLIIGTKLFQPFIKSKKSDKYMSLICCIFLQGLFLLLAYFLDSFFLRIIFFSLINGLTGFYNPLNSIIKSEILIDKYKELLNALFNIPSIIYTIIVYLTLTFMTPFTLALIGGNMFFIAFIIGIILNIALCFYPERNHNEDNNYLGVNIE